MISEYAVSPQSGGLLAASVTATTAATANTLLTLTRQATMIRIPSDLNNPVMVTISTSGTAAGAVDTQYLPSGASAVLDVASDKMFIPVGSVVGVYYTGSAPSSGRIYAQVF